MSSERLFSRESGILIHISSLPGEYGIGEIGASSLKFLDLVAQAGQSLWQILPLNPPSSSSPYQCCSCFAADETLLPLQELFELGLIEASELDEQRRAEGAAIDFSFIKGQRSELLDRVASRFDSVKSANQELSHHRKAIDGFISKQSWLDDYALFRALKSEYGNGSWLDWPAPLRQREPKALSKAKKKLKESVRRYQVLQYLFDVYWGKVREHAGRLGIRIVGDVPIFVALDSSDVWANPKLFLLSSTGEPDVVAGVPPDYFSETGQRWGNPLYDWEYHEKTQFHWWKERIAQVLSQCDILRIDHFRGLESYWEIPSTSPTAIEGRWVKAPGKALFESLRSDASEALPIIAEDLGIITDEVDKLREEAGLPGMKVFQFSFGGEEKDLPSNFPEDCVAYSGTHDNDTICGWYQGGGFGDSRKPEEVEAERHRVRVFLSVSGEEIHWDVMRYLLNHKAQCVIFPVQDIAAMGSAARLNVPGTVGEHNWTWRMTWEELPASALEKLKELSLAAGRNQARHR